MLKNIFGGIKDKYKKFQEEGNLYDKLLVNAYTLPTFYPFQNKDKNEITISPKILTDLCADLNLEDAYAIRSVIPIDDEVISCLYAIECKTNIKLYLVLTTKYLWFIKDHGYLKYDYNNLVVSVIKNGFMSKVVSISNMLFNIHGVNEEIDKFVKFFIDNSYRGEVLSKYNSILCGSVPTTYYLNDIGSGISIGSDNSVIFHTKEFHYKYMIKDIKNYELLLDDMVAREKRSMHRDRLTGGKNSCYGMSIRVTANDKMFIIPILERSTFNTLYSSSTEVFRNNKAFCDTLINLLDDLNEKSLNGEI